MTLESPKALRIGHASQKGKMNQGAFTHNLSFFRQSHCQIDLSILFPQQSCSFSGDITNLGHMGLHVSLQGRASFCQPRFWTQCWQMKFSTGKCYFRLKSQICYGELEALPHVRTLKDFDMVELSGKLALVRFDSAILLREAQDIRIHSRNRALYTIKYLCDAGAKVLLASSWSRPNSTQSVADYLSSVLHVKVVPAKYMDEVGKAHIFLLENLSENREELANCSIFAEKLSVGVDVFVNDAFSLSHRILASTVGITRFCCTSVAGFCFEAELSQMLEITETTKQPYIAIVGGGNLSQKATALRYLVSKCNGLVFVGRIAFQIMNALGMPVPLSFVESGAIEDALEIIQLARERKVPILCPQDFYCDNNSSPKLLRVVPAHAIMEGWKPVDLGPSSLSAVFSLLSKSKKVLWIGPIGFDSLRTITRGTSELALMLEKEGDRDVIVVGTAACKGVIETNCSLTYFNVLENASVVWEFLKGRTLPGVAALDRAYSFKVEWDAIFADPTQPLIVDIGSGNGLFLLNVARKWSCSNFLGLEINKKLVSRCLDSVHQYGLNNVYFISTNATSTFRSIVSSYPGELILVSIQCPSPDFNKTEYRWRMLQRELIEAITDLLVAGGKVFLQSDVEEVARRMKEQFLANGKGRLIVANEERGHELDSEGWLKENPFGVRSDWEQHVLDRGAPMYRLMIFKDATNY